MLIARVCCCAGGMINRDAAPFIFTDDFLYIIGGKEGKKSKNWDEFQDLCCTCYNILRKHADLFINLSATCTPC